MSRVPISTAIHSTAGLEADVLCCRAAAVCPSERPRFTPPNNGIYVPLRGGDRKLALPTKFGISCPSWSSVPPRYHPTRLGTCACTPHFFKTTHIIQTTQPGLGLTTLADNTQLGTSYKGYTSGSTRPLCHESRKAAHAAWLRVATATFSQPAPKL